jgi:hypothetical protein
MLAVLPVLAEGLEGSDAVRRECCAGIGHIVSQTCWTEPQTAIDEALGIAWMHLCEHAQHSSDAVAVSAMQAAVHALTRPVAANRWAKGNMPLATLMAELLAMLTQSTRSVPVLTAACNAVCAAWNVAAWALRTSVMFDGLPQGPALTTMLSSVLSCATHGDTALAAAALHATCSMLKWTSQVQDQKDWKERGGGTRVELEEKILGALTSGVHHSDARVARAALHALQALLEAATANDDDVKVRFGGGDCKQKQRLTGKLQVLFERVDLLAAHFTDVVAEASVGARLLF